jgi:hypothetical protein
MDPEKPTPQSNPLSARSAPAKSKMRPPGRTEISSGGRSARAYVPLPLDEKAREKKKEPEKKKPNRWPILVAAALALAAGSFVALQHHSDPTPIALTASDIDEQATAAAQAALNSGQVPAELAHAGPEVLAKMKSGEMALSQPHRILPPEKSPGTIVHVMESLEGKLVGVDILTDERPIGTPIPISRAGITRVHFTVEQAGSRGTVVCSVLGRASTSPLATGQEADISLTEPTN